MLRKLTVLICLISFCPAAAGAQEVALLVNSEQATEHPAGEGPTRELNLSPAMEKMSANVMAANDTQGMQMMEAPRPKRTHTGLTFKEFCEVHFGEYRWIYWVGAAAAIAAIHIVAAD